MKKQWLIGIGAVMATIAIVSAWNLLNAIPVDPGSCHDSDHGLDAFTLGTINFTINGTPSIFDDFCDTNMTDTLYEFACSDDLPQYNLSDYAAVFSQNCTDLNASFSCVNGRCQ